MMERRERKNEGGRPAYIWVGKWPPRTEEVIKNTPWNTKYVFPLFIILLQATYLWKHHVSYIKLHLLIFKVMSNLLEGLMHYQLVFYILIITDSSFFVPFLLLNYLKKHKMAPSRWLTEKRITENPRVEGDNALAT